MVDNTLANTSTIWKRVERQPLDLVLAMLAKEGWVNVGHEKGELTRVFLKRRTATATIYARNNIVGMVSCER